MSQQVILILAVSTLDAQEMKRMVHREVPDARIIVGTDARSIEGCVVDEMVMTDSFASQRSIRLLEAARRSLLKKKGARA